MSKVHMVRVLSSTSGAGPEPAGLRAMTREDIPLLGKLFLEAYFGTVDYEGESEQEAIEAVQATFDGEFGEFVEASSLLIRDESQQAHAMS